MLYRITAVGVIPGINDQVGGNAHGDSDIGVYRFFCVILRTVYDSPVPSFWHIYKPIYTFKKSDPCITYTT